MIVQSPPALNVTEDPDTEQTPVLEELYEIESPLEELAESVRFVPTSCSPGCVKVIVCGACVTVKERVTSSAAFQSELSAREAVTSHEPAVNIEIAPLTI